MKTNVSEKFLRFVTFDTQSQTDAGVVPSTAKQLEFAGYLVEECKSAGLSEVALSEHGIVTATLLANTDAPEVIGFLAHIDTSDDFSGANVSPQIIYDYDGGDIPLNENLTLSPGEFPELKNYIGKTIIATDGSTLLGADDKAGVAEILSAMEYLIRRPEIPHGKIRVAFTADEEVGHGTDYFDVGSFGADFAYTVDGGGIGEFECENFNAARAFFEITGKAVHPGHAKGIMKNAGLIAVDMITRFPENETPATTEGLEGYYHICEIAASIEGATVDVRIRDFDEAGFERRKAFAAEVADEINRSYGPGTVKLRLYDEYLNMKEPLAKCPEVIERAKKAYAEAGLDVTESPIRGGTDGSRLSYMGLPCPNIFGGGHNFHGPYEYAVVESMEKAVEVIVNICKGDTK